MYSSWGPNGRFLQCCHIRIPSCTRHDTLPYHSILLDWETDTDWIGKHLVPHPLQGALYCIGCSLA